MVSVFGGACNVGAGAMIGPGMTFGWIAARDIAQRAGKKREDVLTTAVKYSNTKGFHATSLDDVGAALNVTRPTTIYRYFSSKDEILFECVRRGLDSIREFGRRCRRAAFRTSRGLRAGDDEGFRNMRDTD